MVKALRDFQVFAKPIGSVCNLNCSYCYYINKQNLYPQNTLYSMTDDILEKYIARHIDACSEQTINFSWHGGEPTLLGAGYFKKIISYQQKYKPQGCRITNGIQTNGTILDDNFCSFLAEESFTVGISIDGPGELHDQYRHDKNQKPTYTQVMQGLALLQKHRIPYDVLCVVHDQNVQYPVELYRFFKEIGARYLTFLPLVELDSDDHSISSRTVPAEAFGEFLCTIFDEWQANDIGSINIQIFEEAIGTAFGREHGLCIFRETCGDIPVIEHNGDFFSCDHFVDRKHYIGNIRDNSLADMIENSSQRAFGNAKRDTLPVSCKTCNVLSMCNGGCPKDRFIHAPDSEHGLNYLCAGYKRFFIHCRPFVQELSLLWREKNANTNS
jgi:uncharacterized protein